MLQGRFQQEENQVLTQQFMKT